MMKISKNKLGFITTIVPLVIAVVALIFFAGLLVYRSHHKTTTSSAPVANSAVTKSTPSSSAQAINPYDGWKTYTSSLEKLSFKYPSNWTVLSKEFGGIPNADSAQFISPTGSLMISWFSAITGLGGACDATIMPGTSVSANALDPCPYWYVLDSQKLTGADLYYVAGIETNDGITYAPWCALQPSNGIVKSEGNIGYQVFRGKNNDFRENGHDYGLQNAGLKCGKGFGDFGNQGFETGTKAQATALLSSSEFKQAKLILLSATY